MNGIHHNSVVMSFSGQGLLVELPAILDSFKQAQSISQMPPYRSGEWVTAL